PFCHCISSAAVLLSSQGTVMNQLLDRVFALCGGALLLATLCVARLAQAQDEAPISPPLPTPPGAHARQVLIADYSHGAPPRIVIVTNGSPVGQIFSNPASGPTFCEEVLQKLQAAGEHHELPKIGVFHKFIRLGCPCAAAGECECAAHAACGSE